MKTQKILGIILISLSVLFFGFFIWWNWLILCKLTFINLTNKLFVVSLYHNY